MGKNQLTKRDSLYGLPDLVSPIFRAFDRWSREPLGTEFPELEQWESKKWETEKWETEEGDGETFYKQTFFSGYPVKPNGLTITVSDGCVCVTYDTKEENHRVYLSETISLPSDADKETVNAKLVKGEGIVVRVEKLPVKKDPPTPNDEDVDEIELEVNFSER